MRQGGSYDPLYKTIFSLFIFYFILFCTLEVKFYRSPFTLFVYTVNTTVTANKSDSDKAESDKEKSENYIRMLQFLEVTHRTKEQKGVIYKLTGIVVLKYKPKTTTVQKQTKF